MKFIRAVNRTLCAICVSILIPGFVAGTAVAADFYEGKVIKIVVGSGPGSAYDLYGRLLAEHMGRHIPGRPTMVVQTMVGAAGLVSAGYMYNAAPRDGTVIASAVSTTPIAPLLRPDQAKYDSSKFNWLGNLAKDIFVGFVWSTVPVYSFDDLKKQEVIMGGINGATSVDYAVLANVFMGTKMKIVSGYDDQTGIKLAIERGELHGTFGSAFSGLMLEKPDWLEQKKIRVIVQHDLTPAPELPGVPLFIDQAKTPEDRLGLELVTAPTEFNKPFYAPPGVPADRVEILRRAFMETLTDPAFIASAATARISIEGAFSGEEMQARVDKLFGTAPAVAERVRQILDAYRTGAK